MKGGPKATICIAIAASAFLALAAVPLRNHIARAQAGPTQPTNVRATLSQYVRVYVSWTASKDTAQILGYHVYRNGALISNTVSTGYSESVVPGNTYTYTVAAYDSAGNTSFQSAPSDPLSVPKDTTPPSSPKWVSITPSTSSVKLSWTAATDNIGVAGYVLYRGDNPVPGVTGYIKQTTYTDKGLPPGYTVHYTLVAYDYAENASTPIRADTMTSDDTVPPTVPTSLKATAKSASEIDLSWNPSSDGVGVAGYYVYRNNARIATVSSTSYANLYLQGGTSYLYAIAAFDAAGNISAKTVGVQATTLAPDTMPPTIPGNLRARGVSASEIDLTWTASTDNLAVAGYDLYRDDKFIVTIASSATSYADKKLATSTTYQYSLRAYDAARNKSAPTTVAATTLSYSPAPAPTTTVPTSNQNSPAPTPTPTPTPAPKPTPTPSPSPSPAQTENGASPPLGATSTNAAPSTTAATSSPGEATSSAVSSFFGNIFSGISNIWHAFLSWW